MKASSDTIWAEAQVRARKSGRKVGAIHDLLRIAPDWQVRFDLVERFLAPRSGHASAIRIQHARCFLAQGHLALKTVAAIGWSTRHVSTKFRRETGIRPVTAARMLRFRRTRALALETDNAN